MLLALQRSERKLGEQKGGRGMLRKRYVIGGKCYCEDVVEKR